MLIQPGEVADSICIIIDRDDHVVVNVIAVQNRKDSNSIRFITILANLQINVSIRSWRLNGGKRLGDIASTRESRAGGDHAPMRCSLVDPHYHMQWIH